MLPTQVPLALAILADAARAAATATDRAATTLFERRLHHVPCNGDASIVELLLDDSRQLRDRLQRLQALASGLDVLHRHVLSRLAVLAADESAVRAWLASPCLTAIQAARVHGDGPWVSTVVGPVRVPVTGDPAWALLAGSL